MNTQALPLPITLHRPWWRRLADALRDRVGAAAASPDVQAASHRDFYALRDLSEATLDDIGAPCWIRERREVVRSVEFDLMRL